MTTLASHATPASALPTSTALPPGLMGMMNVSTNFAAIAAALQQGRTPQQQPAASMPQPLLRVVAPASAATTLPISSLSLQHQQVLQQMQQQTAIAQQQEQQQRRQQALQQQQQEVVFRQGLRIPTLLPPTQAAVPQLPQAVQPHPLVMRPRDVNAENAKPRGQAKKKAAKPQPPVLTVNTSVLNEAGELVETDKHRLAQRRKQICYGKVTEGYANYTKQVKPHEREDGNLMHPSTPRVTQVCSKRDWDTQMSLWRRALHFWDCNLTEEAKERLEAMKKNGHPLGCAGLCCNPRKEREASASAETASTAQSASECGISDVGSNESPRPASASGSAKALSRHNSLQSTQEEAAGAPRKHWTNGIDGPEAVKVKFVVNGAPHCNIVKARLATGFQEFTQLIESKVGPALGMHYTTLGGQTVKVTDDKALHTFLVVVKHSQPPPKLIVDTWGTEEVAL